MAARKNWEVPAAFPNPAVEQAYLEPQVDTAKDRFTCARPDQELLRSFCWNKFGWSHVRTLFERAS
jgi:DNA excision repair protein ERCC-5